MVDRKTEISDHFIHAGAGTGLVLVNLGALIPGLIPVLALTALVTVVLVAPFLILGLAAVIVAAPLYLMSRVVRRARRRRRREERPPAVTPRPIPLPHVS
jgi:membrane protein implicated in regulation of membrane protease activity